MGLRIAEAVFDVEEIYKIYPRKLGKQEGMRRLKKIIKDEETFLLVKKAVINFAEAIKTEGREVRYIPYFSTWINSQWEDWVDYEPEREEIFSFLRR